jgi:hypothetical protein
MPPGTSSRICVYTLVEIEIDHLCSGSLSAVPRDYHVALDVIVSVSDNVYHVALCNVCECR